MITHLKKQEIVVQKKKTKEIACGNESIYHTIQDLKTQPYSIGILTQEAYRRRVPIIGKQNDLGQTFLHTFLMLGKATVKPNTCWEDYDKFDPTTASNFWLVNRDDWSNGLLFVILTYLQSHF